MSMNVALMMTAAAVDTKKSLAVVMTVKKQAVANQSAVSLDATV